MSDEIRKMMDVMEDGHEDGPKGKFSAHSLNDLIQQLTKIAKEHGGDLGVHFGDHHGVDTERPVKGKIIPVEAYGGTFDYLVFTVDF